MPGGSRMMLIHGRIAVAAAVMAACAVGCFGPAAPAPTPTSTVDIRPMVEAAIATALAPTPSPTQDLQSMVAAAVDATLAAAVTPVPTYTPRPTRTPKPTLRPTVVPHTRISIPTRISTIPLAPTLRPTKIYLTVQPPRATVVPSTQTPVPSQLQAVQCGPPCHSDSEPIFPPVDWISGPTISENGVIQLVAVLDDSLDMGEIGTTEGGKFSVTDRDHNLYGTIVAPAAPGLDWVPQPGLWIAEQFDYVANTLRVRAQIDPVAATHPGLRLCLWSGGPDSEKSLLDCVLVQQP